VTAEVWPVDWQASCIVSCEAPFQFSLLAILQHQLSTRVPKKFAEVFHVCPAERVQLAPISRFEETIVFPVKLASQTIGLREQSASVRLSDTILAHHLCDRFC